MSPSTSKPKDMKPLSMTARNDGMPSLERRNSRFSVDRLETPSNIGIIQVY